MYCIGAIDIDSLETIPEAQQKSLLQHRLKPIETTRENLLQAFLERANKHGRSYSEPIEARTSPNFKKISND